ncbi:MAG: alpha-glucan family phosphorylase, partial [Candidatus Aenigmatarchaeota archaeon]
MTTISYLTAEIMLKSDIPTYSGGLGGVAGDTVRAVSNMSYDEFPFDFVATSLLYPEGYFTQRIVNGRQCEEYPRWNPADHGLTLLPEKVILDVHDHRVEVRAWRYD